MNEGLSIGAVAVIEVTGITFLACAVGGINVEVGNAFRTFGISFGGIEGTAVEQTVLGADLAAHVIGGGFVEILTGQEILGITGDGVSVFDGTGFANLFGLGVVLQIIGVVDTGLAGVIDVIADTASITRDAFACRVFGILCGDGHVVSVLAGLALTRGGTGGTSVNSGTILAGVCAV